MEELTESQNFEHSTEFMTKEDVDTVVINLKKFEDDHSAKLEDRISVLKEELEIAHAHIHNLQDAYNEFRNWFSNVEFIPESEDLDEYISLSDCDEHEAVKLRDTTEDFAVGWFRYWYALIKEKYALKTLGDYIKWSDKNLDKLTERQKAILKESEG